MRNIGGYELIRQIGYGGMSTVYEAVNGGGDHVALKLLHPSLAADETSRLRLHREVAVLRKVRSPYVAQVIDAEIDATEPFLVTELVQGLTLEKEVLENGIYTETDLLYLGQQLGRALRSVHAVGVLHRDLKPSNVMIHEGHPVLIDFGIAQAQNDARLTQQGMLALTPGYCDPRVLGGAQPDAQADWWALAAVLAFAATGEPPFGEGNAPAVMARVLRQAPTLPDLDPPLTHAFELALARDLEHRISFEQLLGVIEDPAQAELLPVAARADGAALAPTLAVDAAGAEAYAREIDRRERSREHAAQDGYSGQDGYNGQNGRSEAGGVESRQEFADTSPDATAILSADAGEPTELTFPPSHSGMPVRFYAEAADGTMLLSPATPQPLPTQQITMPMQISGARVGGGVGSAQVTEGLYSGAETGRDDLSPGEYGKEYREEAAPKWARSPRPVHAFVVLMWCALALAGGKWPVVVLCAFGVSVWMLDIVGTSLQVVRERRLKAGMPRVGDSTIAIVRLPVTALAAFARTGVLVAAVTATTYGALWLAAQWNARFGTRQGLLMADGTGAFLGVSPTGVTAIVAGLCALIWLFPSTRRARLGVRYLAGGAAERAGVRWLWIAVAALCVGGAWVLFQEAVQTGVVSFSPLDSAFTFLIY
ncbi:MAG: serine/threonine-protein kinase [Actinomycetaceae bacterium]|nr:serine/threonine-protein kinase [Actinomycetaceae bacterium]MDY5854688.1 serine/threonine-protein kinase [Arcanobacterium sp.]